MDSMEATGLDVGEMLSEDGAFGILARFFSMLPFL